jgi:hypothetical protein
MEIFICLCPLMRRGASTRQSGGRVVEERIETIRKHLDFIETCVQSNSFEDIPENVACIREELNKLQQPSKDSQS